VLKQRWLTGTAWGFRFCLHCCYAFSSSPICYNSLEAGCVWHSERS